IFNDNYNEINIPTNHLDLGTVNYYPNTVFRHYAWGFKVGRFLNKCTFTCGIHSWSIGDYLSDFIADVLDYPISNINNVEIERFASSTLYMPKGNNSNSLRCNYGYLESVAIAPVYQTNINILSAVTFIVDRGSNVNITATVSESNFFLDGVNV